MSGRGWQSAVVGLAASARGEAASMPERTRGISEQATAWRSASTARKQSTAVMGLVSVMASSSAGSRSAAPIPTAATWNCALEGVGRQPRNGLGASGRVQPSAQRHGSV